MICHQSHPHHKIMGLWVLLKWAFLMGQGLILTAQSNLEFSNAPQRTDAKGNIYGTLGGAVDRMLY